MNDLSPRPATHPTSNEWKAAIAVTVLCVGTAVILQCHYHPPAAFQAFLFALSGATLAFTVLGDRRLGPNNEFSGGGKLGKWRVGGAGAALVVIFLTVNHYLDLQMNRKVELPGTWDWQYAAEGWKGEITLEGTHEPYSMKGSVWAKGRRLFQLVGGTLRHDDGDRLDFSADVVDLRVNPPVKKKWTSTAGAGLRKGACFGGKFNVDGDAESWGISLARYDPN